LTAGGADAASIKLGHPLLDDYLVFVGAKWPVRDLQTSDSTPETSDSKLMLPLRPRGRRPFQVP